MTRTQQLSPDFLQVVVAYAADKQWLNALFCQKTPAVSDKQRQIELGTLSPGESTYRTSCTFFLQFASGVRD